MKDASCNTTHIIHADKNNTSDNIVIMHITIHAGFYHCTFSFFSSLNFQNFVIHPTKGL